MVITTGSTPKALAPGASGVVAQTGPDNQPLTEVAERLIPKVKKSPKVKKRAFGASQPGAAFRK